MSYKQIRTNANFGSMMTGRNERHQKSPINHKYYTFRESSKGQKAAEHVSGLTILCQISVLETYLLNEFHSKKAQNLRLRQLLQRTRATIIGYQSIGY